MKIHRYDAGPIAKMAAMQYIVKHFKNLLSWNHRADFDETLYEASATQARWILFKLRPLVDLDLFYGKNEFATEALIQKNETMMYSLEIIAVCDLKITC